ncbi:MAG TPA: acyl-ACP thioesterase domain-containing protein [Solirubrobacteraceae bacterium]|nr:acyl-ACP thioesterase domain-containing protein [Solirubrobacteraceae bacterium]
MPIRTLERISVHVLTEMIPPPPGGRIFSQPARAGLGDCAPSGRARLDSLARWMQDVAYADVEDAGVADHAVWVVRRSRIKVTRFPRFGDRLALRTFCSGTGRAWAERRTTIEIEGDGDGEPAVESVGLWVHLDPTDWHPTGFSARELEVYGATAGDRRVNHRLRHPPRPPDDSAVRPWTFRTTETDVADHVNNAAYWHPLEHELLTAGEPEPDAIDVELEFRAPAQPGRKRVLSSGDWRWIVGDGDEVHASLLIAARGR